MTKREAVEEWLSEADDTALLADGLDDAIIGVSFAQWGRGTVIVYDEAKCIEVLMRDGPMTYEDASEWFEFNTRGAYVGENTPLFVRAVSS